MPLDKHCKQRFVLVCDDEEAVLMTFREAFKGQEEFALDTAKTVREALEKLAQVQYDLIFMDMKMDGNSWAGMSIVREINRLEIRAKSRGHPVLSSLIVVMSGSIPFNEFMHEAHELGILCFMAKPALFTPEFVRRVLNRIGVPLLPPATEKPAWPNLPKGNL